MLFMFGHVIYGELATKGIDKVSREGLNSSS